MKHQNNYQADILPSKDERSPTNICKRKTCDLNIDKLHYII